jgi:hypothetical protein
MVKDGKTIKITRLKDYLEFKGREDLIERIVSKYKSREDKK